jgi:hypothetical protein
MKSAHPSVGVEPRHSMLGLKVAFAISLDNGVVVAAQTSRFSA